MPDHQDPSDTPADGRQSSLTYQNLDLLVEPSGANYRAHVVSSPAGEAEAMVQLPLDELAAAATDPKTAGGALFDAVFVGDLLMCLRSSRAVTEQAGQGLRVRIRLGDAPELAKLPWEALFDRTHERFLALSRETPIVRYMELPEPVRPLTVAPPLHILAVIASPAELPPLHVTREWANLQEALRNLTDNGQVVVDRLEPPTLSALQNRLREKPVHVLHFVGHGAFDDQAGQGILLLEDEGGHANPVTGADLGTLLSDHQPMRVALLNACQGAQTSEHDPYAGVAQKLVQQGIPAVIAMRTAISDPSAIAFSREFYAALADASPVDAAMADARRAVSAESEGRDEWITPVLFMRAPDGILWTPPERTSWRQRLAGPLGLAIAVPIVLLIAAALAWFALVPSQMPLNTFNVALAEFGQVDTAGRMSASADGARLSQWMFDELQAEAANLPGDKQIVLWHDSMGLLQKRSIIGRVRGVTPDERAQTAGRLAKQINAHMIVYGNLEAGHEPAAFVPEFYNSEVRREADEVVGRQVLGAPISVHTPVDLNDQVTVAYFDANLKPKAQALVWLARGLAYDLAGQHDRALAVLREADQQLPLWEENQGREVLYYFIGREAVFLTFDPADAQRVFGSLDAALDTAERAFDEARRIKPDYARAYLGLGNVAYQRSQIALGLIGSPEAGNPISATMWLDLATQQYAMALQYAQGAADSQVAPRAHLALGNTYRLEGYTYLDRPEPDFQAARERFDAALAELQIWVERLPKSQPRMQAQGQQMLGATYQQKAHTFYATGDKAASRPWYEQAQTAYAECVKIADQNIYDQTLKDIKTQSCQPNQQEMIRIVKELEGNP